jgi:hypothetical protein
MRTDDPVLHHEVVTDPEMFAADRSLAARCSDVALDWSTSRQVAESVCGGSPTTREVKNVRQAMEDNLAGLFERRDGPPVEYRAR